MSNYDEVKFLRRMLRDRDATIAAKESRIRKLKDIVVAQQEEIRAANDARRVSQHFALLHLKESLLSEQAMEAAKRELDYSLYELPPGEKRAADRRIWWANFRAWRILQYRVG